MQTPYLFSRVRTNVDIDNKVHNYAYWIRLHLFAYAKGYDFSRKCPPLHPYIQWWKKKDFQQVVCHIMKSVSTCTYIYTYHDLVESQCSPRKLRFGVPFPAPYLVKPDCSAHRFIKTLAVSRTLYSDKNTYCLHIVTYKKWACRWMSRAATQFVFGMRER